MYNLTNSPVGAPLGQAGQANSSTQPQGLFANAGAGFNNMGQGEPSPFMNMGKGLQGFGGKIAGRAQDMFGKMFGSLFGAQGSLGAGPNGAFGPNGVRGIPGNVAAGARSLFGTPGQPGSQGAPQVNNPIANAMQMQQQGGGAPQGGAPGAPPAGGGGFLSRFMQGGQ